MVAYRLLEDFTIMCPITTTPASCLKVGNSKIGESEVFLSGERDQVRHWFSLTGEGKNGRRYTNIKTLPKGLTVEVARNYKVEETKKQLNKKQHKAKQAKQAKQFNATSILTTVKLQQSTCKYDYDVVLTGDSYCTIIDKELALKGKSVGVFQVPHHGSSYNLDDKRINRSNSSRVQRFLLKLRCIHLLNQPRQ